MDEDIDTAKEYKNAFGKTYSKNSGVTMIDGEYNVSDVTGSIAGYDGGAAAPAGTYIINKGNIVSYMLPVAEYAGYVIEVNTYEGSESILILHTDTHHIRQKQMMATQLFYLGHPAFNIYGALGNGRRCLKFPGCQSSQTHLLKLVHIPAGLHTAVICCANQILRSQVDHKLARLLDDIIGIPAGPDGNGYHGRIGADRSYPGQGNDIRFFSLPGTADHYSRQRV